MSGAAHVHQVRSWPNVVRRSTITIGSRTPSRTRATARLSPASPAPRTICTRDIIAGRVPPVRHVVIADVSQRKADHLREAAGPGVLHATGNGLDAVRLRHRALPGRDLDAVDAATRFLGARPRRAGDDLRDDGRHGRGRRRSTASLAPRPRSATAWP